MLDRIGKAKIYRSLIVPHIHALETSFNIINYQDLNQISDIWTIIADNPFPKNILTNNTANLSLTFNHPGRTLYNKYTNFDVNLKYNDENSYNQLLGFVTLSLAPPQTIPLSVEYINWCNSQEKLTKIFYVLGNHESYNFSYEETNNIFCYEYYDPEYYENE